MGNHLAVQCRCHQRGCCQTPQVHAAYSQKAIAKDNTLYVGKVQSHIVGRVIQHLGYHLNQASHGLQLNDWAKSMNLTFKLHIIVLPHDVIPVEEIFETELAHKYEPLIGIH